MRSDSLPQPPQKRIGPIGDFFRARKKRGTSLEEYRHGGASEGGAQQYISSKIDHQNVPQYVWTRPIEQVISSPDLA